MVWASLVLSLFLWPADLLFKFIDALPVQGSVAKCHPEVARIWLVELHGRFCMAFVCIHSSKCMHIICSGYVYLSLRRQVEIHFFIQRKSSSMRIFWIHWGHTFSCHSAKEISILLNQTWIAGFVSRCSPIWASRPRLLPCLGCNGVFSVSCILTP